LFSVRHLILDEADRLLDAEFLAQTQEIMAACSHPDIQKAVFSATLPAAMEKIAMEMMRDPVRIVVGLKYVSRPNSKYFANLSKGYPTTSHSTEPDLCC